MYRNLEKQIEFRQECKVYTMRNLEQSCILQDKECKKSLHQPNSTLQGNRYRLGNKDLRSFLICMSSR